MDEEDLKKTNEKLKERLEHADNVITEVKKASCVSVKARSLCDNYWQKYRFTEDLICMRCEICYWGEMIIEECEYCLQPVRAICKNCDHIEKYPEHHHNDCKLCNGEIKSVHK